MVGEGDQSETTRTRRLNDGRWRHALIDDIRRRTEAVQVEVRLVETGPRGTARKLDWSAIVVGNSAPFSRSRSLRILGHQLHQESGLAGTMPPRRPNRSEERHGCASGDFERTPVSDVNRHSDLWH